jgi:hypothetical protein
VEVLKKRKVDAVEKVAKHLKVPEKKCAGAVKVAAVLEMKRPEITKVAVALQMRRTETTKVVVA